MCVVVKHRMIFLRDFYGIFPAWWIYQKFGTV
nr:MAG TPA: hypothetical protein [Caudoviricetes sp.]